jgi:hypothetical protein
MDDLDDTRPYCIEGCGSLAVGERLVGMLGEDEIVELVCYDHAQEDDRG